MLNLVSLSSMSPSRRQWLFLILALAVGFTLRLIYPSEIELKHDEAEMMWYIERFPTGEMDWPWVGQLSSNGLRHPGLGIWLYLAPSVVFGIKSPVAAAQITQIFGCAALVLLALFAQCVVPLAQRSAWRWATALACVNPLEIMLERKLWHPSLLPFFTILFVMAWWVRGRPWLGAFSWGLLGALCGQIHMSGFFFALALLLCTVVRDRMNLSFSWKHWLAGSFLGALPLIPWLNIVIFTEGHDPLNFKPHRWIMFRYWLYWIRGTFGWNSSKIAFGDDAGEFYALPTIAGTPTYLVALAHLVLVAAMVVFVFVLGRWGWRHRKSLLSRITQAPNDTRLLLNATFFWTGLIVTLSATNVTRYVHLAVYPSLFLFLAYVMLRHAPRPRMFLSIVVAAQLFLSAAFLQFLHKSTCPTAGDFGISAAFYLNEKKLTCDRFNKPRP